MRSPAQPLARGRERGFSPTDLTLSDATQSVTPITLVEERARFELGQGFLFAPPLSCEALLATSFRGVAPVPRLKIEVAESEFLFSEKFGANFLLEHLAD